ncbi:DUF948 domain-containing protein [Levilactobacillus bambusae]|uniref:DUF948 domain-containing protein n=1 Tax=Levilactobacillus bambusae TaxID=2024736 RepID=A0A2V1MYN7_9LACO|nr:DUF948 domain-containing protein [Levilactobacillus bambusae]PWF99597.1 DUF948 domain-containing protein [Levilactobacillus bambusae]
MTGGQVAGLIAAIAFLILVLFIGMFLTKLNKTLGQLNASMKTMTDDIDVISKQAENILASSNVLLDDVNEKFATIDPVFQAAADLGTSVSDLNDATRNLTAKVSSNTKTAEKASVASRFGRTAFNMYSRHRAKKADSMTTPQ